MNKLTALIARLPYLLRRSQCVEVLRIAGLSEWKIKQGMALLPKYHVLGCKTANYHLDEFLNAFTLPAPASSAHLK